MLSFNSISLKHGSAKAINQVVGKKFFHTIAISSNSVMCRFDSVDADLNSDMNWLDH